MKNENKNKLYYFIVMCIFGCLGPVVRGISLPSEVIVFFRAWIAALSILFFFFISRKKFSKEEIKEIIKPMLCCGFLLVLDWIGLFTSYSYTSIATATLCYYTCPVFVLLGGAVFLKEKLTKRALICIVIAFIGMIFASGAFENGMPKLSELTGVLFALLGSVSYAGIILINKKSPEGNPLLRTFLQLCTAAVMMTPYVFLRYPMMKLNYNLKSIVLLLLLGVVMTGIAYIAYFSLIVCNNAKFVAIFSYADPVLAVIVSAVILGEPMTLPVALGAILIITAAIASEKK